MTSQFGHDSSHRSPSGPGGPERTHREVFYWRALTSFVVVAGFTMIAVSGVVLYVTPPGRIANWSGWSLVGLTRANWQALHMVFGLTFLVASAFHLSFNWRALLSYLRTRLRSGVRRRRELGWATAVSLALAVLSVANVPPVSFVFEGREAIADSWSNATTEPPIPHLELLTVTALAGTLKLDEAAALQRLAEAGIQATSSDSLEALAEREGRTPRDLYAVLASQATTGPDQAALAALATGGLGSRTLGEVALAAGLGIDEAVEKLHQSGVEARAAETLREIATRAGQRPPEVAALLGIPVTH